MGQGASLRVQRKALRRRLNDKRREIAERLANLPEAQKRKSRKRWLLGAAVLLIIMLCLSKCRCTDAGPTPPPKPQAAVVKVEKVLPPQAKRQAAPANKATPRLRARYQTESATEPAWVEAFRLQVAARSQRLSECFVGTSRPGAIRWTASITAETGAVFDHHIDPMPPGEDLSAEQQRCVVGVLAKPGYQKLATIHAGALPETVSLVLEF
jgi:hypothetical protein